MELTSEQKKYLIQAINKRADLFEPSMAFKARTDTQLTRLAEKFMASGKAKFKSLPEADEAQPGLFEETGIALVTPSSIFSALNKILGPEKMAKFINARIRHNLEKAPRPDAFLVDKAEEEDLYGPVTIDDWQLPTSLKDLKLSANEILSALSDKDREEIFKGFDFTYKWQDGELLARKKAPLIYRNYYIDLDAFLDSALLRIEAENKDFDEDELVDKLADILNEIGKNESDFYNSEEYAKSSDTYGIEQDAMSAGMDEIKEKVDSDIEQYIEELEELGVDESDIKEMLVEASDEEFYDTAYRVTNSISSQFFSSEEQIDFDDDRYDEINDPTLPYPNSLYNNVALLSDEGAKALEKSVNEMSIRIRYKSENDCYQLQHAYLHVSENRRIDLVVNPEKFISKAKRKIKDIKMERREKGEEDEKQSAASSFEESSMKIQANDIAKKSESLPPMAKREMIAKLYEAIARSALPMEEARIQWMVNFIYDRMSDREINMEWDFIRKGNVAKLVKLFQTLQDPEVQKKHADKIYDLQRLHEEISEGMQKTKEAGLEVDDSTFQFLEKTVMEFADNLIEELQGQKALPGQDKKLLNSKEVEAGKKEESKIQDWLLNGEDFGKDGDSAWAKGDLLYSYRTIIAKREDKSLYVNQNKYSQTTSKMTRYVTHLANDNGYAVMMKPEEFFNTSMREKLPGGYKEQAREILLKILKDENLVSLAKDLPNEDLAWVKLAKLGIRKYAPQQKEAFNQELLRMLASHLKLKLGERLQLASLTFPIVNRVMAGIPPISEEMLLEFVRGCLKIKTPYGQILQASSVSVQPDYFSVDLEIELLDSEGDSFGTVYTVDLTEKGFFLMDFGMELDLGDTVDEAVSSMKVVLEEQYASQILGKR